MAYSGHHGDTEEGHTVKTEIAESVHTTASAEQIWSIIGDFGSIADWHPAILASPTKGNVRILSLDGGVEVQEEVVEHSDADRYYVYTILSSPFPMTDYRSRLSVSADGSGARMDWTGEFQTATAEDAATFEGVFRGVYHSGMESIRERVEAG
jgi:hypothetical protein